MGNVIRKQSLSDEDWRWTLALLATSGTHWLVTLPDKKSVGEFRTQDRMVIGRLREIHGVYRWTVKRKGFEAVDHFGECKLLDNAIFELFSKMFSMKLKRAANTMLPPELYRQAPADYAPVTRLAPVVA